MRFSRLSLQRTNPNGMGYVGRKVGTSIQILAFLPVVRLCNFSKTGNDPEEKKNTTLKIII